MRVIPAVAIKHSVKGYLRLDWHGLRSCLWPESGALSPIPALDGLRGVAVLLVMAFHAWSFLPGADPATGGEYQAPMDYGRTGVQLFFVLSGFLLFLPYARWLFGLQPPPSTRLFYQRRALRVGPAYWANLGIMTLVALLALSPQLGLLGSGLAHIFFLHNVFFIRAVDPFNNVFWTMAVEVQFYAILPALGWITCTLARHMRQLPAAALLVASLTLISAVCTVLEKSTRFNSIPYVSSWLVTRFGLPFWISVFAAGILCSVAYTYLRQVVRLDSEQSRALRKWSTGVFAAGLGLGLGVTFLPVLHHLPYKNQLFGWIYAAMLFGVLLGLLQVRALFESRALRLVGLISYSLYLWHLIVLLVVEPHLTAVTAVPMRTILGFGLDVLIGVPVAYLSFQLTERPFFKTRKRAHDAAAYARHPGGA